MAPRVEFLLGWPSVRFTGLAFCLLSLTMLDLDAVIRDIHVALLCLDDKGPPQCGVAWVKDRGATAGGGARWFRFCRTK